MREKIRKHFPWMTVMQEIFLNSFDGDCKIDMLKKFQQTIAEEMQKVQITCDLKKTRLLLKGIKYFYDHFCRILQHHNKFSYHMERTWVVILSSIIKIYVFLSRGVKKLRWIEQALDLIRSFPGEKHLVYDALLYIHSLDTKHKAAYAAILKGLLMDKRPFVPLIIDDPAEFLKVYLLVRRLKIRIKNPCEKTKLHLRASKIRAPRRLWFWLLEHDLRIPSLSRYGVRRLNLGKNIESKLEGSDRRKFLKKLREVLLPGLSSMIEEEKNGRYVKNWFGKKEYLGVASAGQVSSEDDQEIKAKTKKSKGKKRKTSVSVPCTYQISSENDKEVIALNETKVKNKKLKGRKKNHQENGTEDMTEDRFKNLEDKFSKVNAFISKYRDSTVSTCDNDELVMVKKSKKKQKSIHLEENPWYETENVPLQECSPDSSKLEKEKIKRQRKLTLTKIAKKMMKRAIDDIGKDSCQPKTVVEQIAGKRKQHRKVSEEHQDCDGNSDSENKLKTKRQREKIATKKNLDNVNVTPYDLPSLENVTQTNNNAKNRKKNKKRPKIKQLDNAEENGLIAVRKKSAEHSLIFTVSPRDHSLPEDISQSAKVAKSSRKKQKRQKMKQSSDSEETKLIAVPMESNEDPCLSNSRIVDYDSTCSDSKEPVISKVVDCFGTDPDSTFKKKNKHSKMELKSNPNEANITAENIFIIDSEPSPCLSESDATRITYDTIYNAEPENTSLCKKPKNISKRGDNLNSSDALADLQDKDLPPEGTKGSCISSSSDPQEPIPKKERRISSGNQIYIDVNGENCLLEEGDSDIPARVTIEKTTNSSEAEPALESCGPPEGVHSYLNSNSCTETIEMQKDEHPSIETIELISATDKVETNLIVDAKTTENYADLTVITQINKQSEPLVDSTLRIEEIWSQDVADIRYPDMIETDCSVTIKSETPPKHSVSNLPENEITLNSNDSSLEVAIKEEKLTSNSSLQEKINSEMVSDSNSNSSIEIDRLEVNTEIVNTNTSDIQRLSPNGYFAYVRPVYELRGLFIDAKSPASDDLHADSEMLNHQINEFAPQNLIGEAMPYEVETPNTSAAKAIMGRILIFAESAGGQNVSTGQNVRHGDFTSTPVSPSVNNLFSTPLVKNEKPAECLSFSDISIEKVGSLEEIQNLASLSSETLEFLQYRDSSQEDDNRSEDTLSVNKSILKTDGSDYPSDATNGSEGEESNMSPRSCNSSDGSTFRNCETYVVKTECCWNDAITSQPFDMVDADDELEDDEELEDDDELEDDEELEDDDQQDTKCSQANETDMSTKMMQLEAWKWNPVVNLGERCDSKEFIDINSSVSVSTTNASLLPVIKSEEEENNAAVPCNSNEASILPVVKTENEEKNVTEPLTVDRLSTPVNEMGRRPETVEQSVSITGKHDEVSLESDVKIETQIQNKAISTEDQKSAELSNEKNLSHDSKATIYHKSPKLSCDKDQETVEVKKENEPSQDHKITGNGNSQELSEIRKDEELGVMLRNTPVSEVKTEKSMASNDSALILSQESPTNLSTGPKRSTSDGDGPSVSQDISEAPTKNLRSRIPSSSSQGKSASVNESSNAVNQDNSATMIRNLRSRDPCLSSSQVKSVPANEDATATRRMNLRSRNASTSSTQENKKRGSQTVTTRSSKRIKKEINFDFDFSELSLNSPKSLRGGKRCNTSNKNGFEVVNEEPPANNQENPSRRLTRASVISTVNSKMKEQDTDPDGYNLRSRKPVIMPGKLQL